jgi:GMP synthase (glutamine-hydrolysing)
MKSMNKVLVYNCMEFSEKIRLFREGIEREVAEAGVEAEYIEPLFPETFSRIDEFTHLIISGSEASAMDESLWTEELTRLIRLFVEKNKKILGICYGHQFLARALCGKQCLYKLPLPEYGYSKISLKENRLFQNIKNPVVLQLHYDAVRNLPADFEIIAENETSVQAFQYKGMDVFGVQFHPEFDQTAAQYFLAKAKKSDPAFPTFYRNELKDENILAQNGLFIRNFLGFR